MELSDPSTKLYSPDVSVAGAQVTPVIDSGISPNTQDITWFSKAITSFVDGVIVAAEALRMICLILLDDQLKLISCIKQCSKALQISMISDLISMQQHERSTKYYVNINHFDVIQSMIFSVRKTNKREFAHLRVITWSKDCDCLSCCDRNRGSANGETTRKRVNSRRLSI